MGGKGKVWWWIVVALFLLAFLWFVPQLQGRYFSQGVPAEEIPALVNEYRRTWAQILGGAALLSGIYFTWRTLQVNREGQITERFTRAIDQFGSEQLEIRLGGIYSLERIARESEEDHWPIMEVLTTYVRHHAPYLPVEDQQGEEEATIDKKSEEGSKEATETTAVLAPAPDIQAIMTVIRRRTRSFGTGEPDFLHLHETNLSGANLFQANLLGAHLYKANFFKANLARTHLTIASFFKSNLTDADLNFADLSSATLENADLSGADLSYTDLTEANLTRADLSGANLYGADLSGANFSGANLSGVNLSIVWHLTQKQLEETTGDENTHLPSDLKPPAHWSGKTDEQIEGD